jgi:prepilin-type N-terminal cleavage/methylation domain-containing protein
MRGPDGIVFAREKTMVVQRTGARFGFTIMEIMIVVAIVALLAIMAFPSFAASRMKSQKNACINNLRQISHAKDRYALDRAGTTPTAISHLVPAYIQRLPICPAKGAYTVRALGTDPTCNRGSTQGHTI